MLRLLLATIFLLSPFIPASAQTLGSVIGPTVTDGLSEAQYRFSYVPGEAGAPDRFGHRVHWSKALDERRLVRFVAIASGPSGEVDLSSLGTQFLLELTPETARTWKSGMRFDLTAGLDDRASSLAAHWANEFDLGHGWSARAVASSSVQFGSHARDGVFLGSRAHLRKRLSAGQAFGIEMFNSYGSTSALGSFDEQNHRAGPFLSLPLQDGWTFYSGVLFGLSGGAADQEGRLWIGKAF